MDFQELIATGLPPALRAGGLEGARAALAMQGAALAATAPLLRAWLLRREDSLAAARRLIDELGTARGPADALAAQQVWWAGASQRLAEDAGAWVQFGVALLRAPGAGVAPAAAAPEPAPARPRMMPSQAA